jgi:hypothetical protein
MRRHFLRLLVAPRFVLVLLLAALPLSAQLGFFRVDTREGRWWFIDPAGNPFISTGIDTMRYDGDPIDHTEASPYRDAVSKIYPDRNTWALDSLARLRLWGFNTVGAWSDANLWDKDVAYTVILDIAEHAGADWEHGKPVDVYDPQFEQVAQQIAERECAPRSNDHWLLGYFSDNELRWGPDWRGKQTMLQMYLELPLNSAGRQHALDFLRDRYGDSIKRLNLAWMVHAHDFAHLPTSAATPAYQTDSDAFLDQVATRYFDVCARVIHDADANHLYLGARFAGRVPDPVLRGARQSDVVSVNIYEFDPRPLAHHMFEVTGKPILITEFAFRATDSGLPNTRGAGPKVPDQAARAKAFTDYVTELESLPEAVGYHWFQWSDEPKEGRFDGENSNYGMLNINNQPYESFVTAVKAANAAALGVHNSSR